MELKKYRISCETCGDIDEMIWRESDPTLCPVDSEHTINDLTIIEQFSDYRMINLDGKEIIHETSRPLGAFTYFTGASDSQADPHAVGGDEDNTLFLDLPSGTANFEKYLDLNIIMNKTSLHEGYLQWKGACGDIIKMEIVPRLTPTSASTGTKYNLYADAIIVPADDDGLLEIDDADRILVQCVENEDGVRPAGFWDATWNETTKAFDDITPAPNGDGEFNMFDAEFILARFCNWIPALGDGFMMLQSADQSRVGHGMRFKVSAKTKGDAHSWSCASFMTFHRKATC